MKQLIVYLLSLRTLMDDTHHTTIGAIMSVTHIVNVGVEERILMLVVHPRPAQDICPQ